MADSEMLKVAGLRLTLLGSPPSILRNLQERDVGHNTLMRIDTDPCEVRPISTQTTPHRMK